jgi:fibro-slime domain-containing protein
LAVGEAVSQQYEPWQAVDVTFYDFKHDRSNPEFEQPHGKYNGSSTTARPGMVTRLDADGKPVAASPSNNAGYLNQGIRFWFRDWSKLNEYKMADSADPLTSGKKYLDKFRPIYTYGNNPPPEIKGGSGNEWDDQSLRWRKNAYTLADFENVPAPAGSGLNPVTIANGNIGISDAFENRVIKGRLWFQHIGNGVYQFSQNKERGGDGFFPLDNAPSAYTANGRTPGVEFPAGGTVLETSANRWKKHNYAFTMELVCEFTMQPGLTFEFTGDDDVWVFINKRLAVDVGGIHEAVTQRVNLDDARSTLGGLVNGQKYELRMFYSERHTDDSNIKITTNIISARVGSVELKIDGSNMVAGVPKPVKAVVKTDEGELITNYAKGWFTWSVKDLGGVNNSSQLTIKSATNASINKTDTVLVTALKAYTTVRIYATYYDSTTASRAQDSVDVWVGPNKATKLFVEASGDSLTSLRESKPLDTIIIAGTAWENNNFYGILRDDYGNWVGRAVIGTGSLKDRRINWSTANTKVAVANKADTSRGQGVARKDTSAITRSVTGLTVTYVMTYESTFPGMNPATLTGKSNVLVLPVNYSNIQIGVKQGGTFIPVSSSLNPNNPGTITMIVGTDTTLYVRMQREGTDIWDEVPASWLLGGGLNGTDVETPVPSGNTVSWNMKPKKATPTNNPATVTVTIPGVGKSVTVNVVVKHADPSDARFFYMSASDSRKPVYTPLLDNLQGARPTTPRMYVSPSATVTLVAGEAMPIVGILFAGSEISNDTWLKDYATSGKNGKWSWTITRESPTCSGWNSVLKQGCQLDYDGTPLNDSATFKSTVAHNTYQIRGTFTQGDGANKIEFSHDIWVRVIPDASKPVLVIEPNNQGMAISPNAKQELDTLVFGQGDTLKQAFAVIRDTYGNYICPSGAPNPYKLPNDTRTEVPTAWASLNTASVTASNGYIPWGEGVVERIGSAKTEVTAYDSYWAKGDSVPVRFRNYGYSEIMIVKKCDAGQIATVNGVKYCDVGPEIEMTSTDTGSIFVLGKRDDNETWEAITGDWGRDPGLINALGTPPSGTNIWTLTPTGTGAGKITVKNGNREDEVNVVITVGPPTYAVLKIITPASDIKAGKEIEAVIEYYNKNGLMLEWNPAWVTPGATFKDNRDKGPTTQDPKVLSTLPNEQILCYAGYPCANTNAKLEHSATNLNDAAKFKIYYATEHTVTYSETITVGGKQITLTDSKTFTVLPGEPADIKIIGDGVVNDSLVIDVEQSDRELILRSVSVDEWGNPTGDYSSNWTDKTPVGENFTDRPVIVYDPSKATENGCGYLSITGVANPSLKDTIVVCIQGLKENPRSAVTRDYDGCGYLDRIEMKFKKPIYFAGSDSGKVARITKGKSEIGTKVNIPAKGGISWTVDSVTVNPGDSTVIVWLQDVMEAGKHSGSTQTGETPAVKVGNGLFAPAVKAEINTSDGAPPVIASAKLYFPKESTGKVADNYIEVKFSEKVRSWNGTSSELLGTGPNARNTLFPPDSLFNIWVMGSQNKALQARTRALSKAAEDPYAKNNFVLQDTRLAGIKEIVYIDETTVRFYLLNGKEISPPNDYINIRTEDQGNGHSNPTHIRDVSANMPDKTTPSHLDKQQQNRKVPITFGNEPNTSMKAIPNPASPDGKEREITGSGGKKVSSKNPVVGVHDRDAVRLIKDGVIGGTVFEISSIWVPNKGKMKCQIKVYDLAGNLVVSAEEADAAVGLEKGTSVPMHLYWNGYNAKEMKVAPGTYRMVVYITYSGTDNDERAKAKKLQGVVGMSK